MNRIIEAKEKLAESKNQVVQVTSKIKKDRLPKENSRPSGYIGGFDGIRTICVLAIIFYHLVPGSLKGGYLAIPVFFVLTGFLLTSRMMKEWDSIGKIAVGKFYVKRVKRIYPTLLAVLIFSSAYITLFQRDLLYNLHKIVVSSVLMVNNWWQITEGLSYFDNFSTESPFTHIWFLSVEGQNYIIAPILMILLLKLFQERKKISTFFLIAAGASAIWMAILYVPKEDPSRVYYGTDTRIFSIWLGCALAMIFYRSKLWKKVTGSAIHFIDLIGLAAFILLGVSFVFLDSQYTFVYYGGMALVSVLAMIFVGVTAIDGSKWGVILSNPVFAWIGDRSYGIYLYQFPVMVFYEAKVMSNGENIIFHTIVKIIIILIISELSYRFIEIPVQKYDYKSLPKAIKGLFKSINLLPQFIKDMPNSWKSFKSKRLAITIIITVVMIVIAAVGLAIAPSVQKSEDQIQLEALIEKNKRDMEEQERINASFVLKNNVKIQAFTKEADAKAAEEQRQLDEIELSPLIEKYDLTLDQLISAKSTKFTMIGDSVLLTVAAEMQEVFPDAILDGEVGRHTFKGPDIIRDMESTGNLNDIVVMELGINGTTAMSVFEEIMELLGDRKVYWINGHDPSAKSWQDDFNEILLDLEKQYDNLTIIDWYSFSYANPEWYYADLAHPNITGAKKFVNMMVNNIVE